MKLITAVTPIGLTIIALFVIAYRVELTEWWELRNEYHTLQAQCPTGWCREPSDLYLPFSRDGDDCKSEWRNDQHRLSNMLILLSMNPFNLTNISMFKTIRSKYEIDPWKLLELTQFENVLKRLVCESVDLGVYSFKRGEAVKCYQERNLLSCATLDAFDLYEFTDFLCLKQVRLAAYRNLVQAKLLTPNASLEQELSNSIAHEKDQLWVGNYWGNQSSYEDQCPEFISGHVQFYYNNGL